MTGNRLWGLGVGLAIVAVIVLGWLLGISPVLAQTDAANEQLASIQAQNQAQEASIAALAAQFQKLPALKKDLAALQKEIPDSPDLENYIDELASYAQQFGVRLSSYAATEAVPYGSAVAAPTPTTATPATPAATTPPASGATAAEPTPAAVPESVAGKLFTVPVAIGLEGSPANVMAFVKACQLDKRFFLVTSVTFTAVVSPPTGTLTGYLFVLRDPVAYATKPKPTATPTPTPTPSATPTPTPSPSATPEPDATEEPTG